MPNEPSPPAPDPFTPDLSGHTLLGTYRVERYLADGGMGRVYLARDVSLDRAVIVKVPHPRFLAEPGFRERFAAEIAGLVRLEHPHVVRILGRGEEDGVPFLVLQYLGGGSLESRLESARRRRLPVGEIVSWLPAVATTLDVVHERGYLHRDVKPANILFDEEGHPFLSDFGVAKAVESDDAGRTNPGTGVGSPRYMAPEQAIGDSIGPAADQYALASCVYECLAGSPPFARGGAVETMVAKTKEEAPPIAARASNLPPVAADAVMRALSRVPEARFGSCRGFAEAFLQGLGLAVPGTPAPTTGTRIPTVPRRAGRRRYVVGIAAGLALAATAAVLLGIRPPPSGAPAEPHRTEVHLSNAGAEPRQLLRYQVAAGARERVHIDLEMRTQVKPQVAPGASTSDPAPAAVVADRLAVDAEVNVEKVNPSTGEFEYTLEVLDVTLPSSGPDPEAERPRHWFTPDEVRPLVGVRLRATADALGRVRAFERTGSTDALPSNSQSALELVHVGLREAFVPLPAEPVGVGAEWTVAETGIEAGIWSAKATSYKLREKAGYELTIETDSGGVRRPRDLSLPGVTGFAVRLGTMTTSTRGTVVQNLTQLAPVSGAMRGTADVSIERTGAKPSGDLEIVTLAEMRRVEKDVR